ncbi:MAG: CoA-binding protein [Deltaproteobacteria bacterium]|nr:CoA-binding protein [Deltaproteobacteria bacterium]
MNSLHTHDRMKGFFSPRHIAVIGASENNLWFGNMLDNARRSNFDGTIYPVNPKADEVWGVKAYRKISDLPAGIIDLAVIILKSQLVLDAVKELSSAGIKNIILLSSGYAEIGGEGITRQMQLQRYCRDNGILLMGPNCLGFMNMAENVSVFTGGAVEGNLLAGTIAVVGQSGATSEIVVSSLLDNFYGISLYATTGNEAVLTVEDYMEYLVHDDRTRVIAGFIEGFRNIPKLKEVAYEAARRRIPIIVIKVGRSEKAQKAASSHTGALAGNDGVLDGFFRQHGIIRVDSIEDMVATAGIFSRLALPGGKGLGICTLSGGLCGLYADLCELYGISLPSLTEATIKKLTEALPDFAQPDNPLDVTGSGFQTGMDRINNILLDDENIDLLVTLTLSPKNSEDKLAHAVNDWLASLKRASSKPIALIPFKEMTDYARSYFNENGLYYIEQPQTGLKAVSHFMKYAEFIRNFEQNHDDTE